jgi:hypothetical protein
MSPPAASALLTIAIPTFQRNALLATNLAPLLAQAAIPGAEGRLRILILDNASDMPVAETLGALPAWVEIKRHPANVGGNGNILRCFESCSTPWLWIIGDDDRPEPDALEQVFRHIALHPSVIAIVSAVRNQVDRPTAFATTGAEELLRHLDSFANLLFVPSTLYHVAALRPRLDLGHHYAYSCAPHLVLLLTALAGGRGGVAFVTESYIAFERPEVEIRGSIIPIALGLPTLAELPDLSPLARSLLLQHLGRFPSLGSLLHQTLLRQVFGHCGVMKGVEDYLSALCRLPWRAARMRRIQGLLAVPALLVPRLSYPVVAWLFARLTGQASGRHKLPLERV